MEKVAVYQEENVNYIDVTNGITEEFFKSDVARMIKELFVMLELDAKNIGKDNWNPLSDNIIKPGQTVLLKPNMVMDVNPLGDTECLFTQACVVAAVVPYVIKALDGEGKIIIADAPMQSCEFSNFLKISGYDKVLEYFKKQFANIEIKDMRGLSSYRKDGVLHQSLQDDNGVVVDLGKLSEHANLSAEAIANERITCYDPAELKQHHNETKHEYRISKDVLEADVIINLPKPKAHRKAGVTIGLKNFVGVNTRKEYLPHHRKHSQECGGDEYKKNSLLLKLSANLMDVTNKYVAQKKYKLARLLGLASGVFSRLDRIFITKQQFREGSWYGNDTIWRTIIDINRIVRFANKDGVLKDEPQRKLFNIADMIVVGEKEGPLLPSPKKCGVLVASRDIVCFDEVIASIMGFDIKKIPLFKNVRRTDANLSIPYRIQ